MEIKTTVSFVIKAKLQIISTDANAIDIHCNINNGSGTDFP